MTANYRGFRWQCDCVGPCKYVGLQWNCDPHVKQSFGGCRNVELNGTGLVFNRPKTDSNESAT